MTANEGPQISQQTTPVESLEPDKSTTRDKAPLSFWLVAIVVMAVTSVPYLYGLWLQGSTPAMARYSGFTVNICDSCVYMSWMEHAAEGHFFETNLFTTQPQPGRKFNLFFVGLGSLGHALGLPAPLTHIARVLLGLALLRAVWWLLGLMQTTPRVRWAALFMVIFSSGIGWLVKALSLWHPVLLREESSDLWQIEGYTFLSLYWSPLFLVSLLLMVLTLGFLLTAEQRQTYRHAFYAGFCAMLLGNIHTYDIVPLGLSWCCFLVVRCLLRGRIGIVDTRSFHRTVIVGAMAAVTCGYQYYILKTDPVFAARVKMKTLSPEFLCYFTGYAIPLLLAAVAALMAVRNRFMQSSIVAADGSRKRPTWPQTDLRLTMGINNQGALLMIVWVACSFAAAYAPVTYQRKLIMGVHLPMAILAGLAVAYLFKRLRGWKFALAVGIVVALTAPSHYLVLRDHMRALKDNITSVRPFMYAGEVKALEWLRNNTDENDAIQPLPWIEALPENQYSRMDEDLTDPRGHYAVALLMPTPQGLMTMGIRDSDGVFNKCTLIDTTLSSFVPGMTGRRVDAGHFSETPNFKGRSIMWAMFVLADTPDERRISLLRSTGVKYVIFNQKHDQTGSPLTENTLLSLFRGKPPPYLVLVPEASNEDADVYKVVLPGS